VKRNPWLKFYPQDWRGDARLQSCSLAARGLWICMIGLMHEAQPYGYLVSSRGGPMGVEELARVVGEDTATVDALLTELLGTAVAGRITDSDNRKWIVSRRLLRDEQRRQTNQANAAKGGNPVLGAEKRVRITDSDNRGDIPSRAREPEARGQRVRDSGSSHSLRDVETRVVETHARGDKPRRAGGGTPLTRLWDQHWERTRLGVAFGWSAADAVSLAKCLKLASGDQAEVERRMVALLESDDTWTAQNATPRILRSQWNKFAVTVLPRPRTKAERMDAEVAALFDNARPKANGVQP